MKRLISCATTMFLDAAINEPATQTTTAQPTPKPEPTSEKLTELKATQKTQWNALRAIEEPTSKEYTDAKLALYKTEQDIKAEIAAILKAENDAEIELQRNERIKLRIAYKDAILANLAAQAAIEKIAVGKRTPEQIEAANAANDAEKNAADIVDNQLLGRYAHSKPSTTATGTKTTGERGGKAADILAQFHANRASGMNDTENKKAIVASGHAVGTVGSVVLAWQRENGEAK